MNNREVLEGFSKDELIELIGIYSKNWLAHDGVWFQSIEGKLGMDEAVYHDIEAWRRFTVTEARRLKQFLGLSERPGLEGLKKALELRFYGSINDYEITIKDNKLIFRNTDCRVQTARKSKNIPYHPCKPVGVVEHSGFGRAIDDRISCKCLSCYPEITDESCSCSWEFTLEDDNK